MPRLIYLTEFSATAYWTEVQVGCHVWTGSALRAFMQSERGRGNIRCISRTAAHPLLAIPRQL